ncbi:class I lanthipeptide [Aquimarina algiphila]|uniref:class I lanthipeptide n=1 Tax=Aquimarina algiphila TaxID=2047982 RepID=UPI00232EBF8B|nr:class I lanthipeptide [Aquimarina algiphila]
MKKQNTNKISLKKLTITRINVASLQSIKGGTSNVTDNTVLEVDGDGVCYDIK